MRLRIVLVAGLAALLLAPDRSAGQQVQSKIPRVGILSPADSDRTPIFDAFREGLRTLGWVEGRNITIEYRLAAGDATRLPEMARELIRLPVDVIVTDGQKSAAVAHEATRTIPIAMGIVGDPLAAGVTGSVAHPGGNVTGFTLLSSSAPSGWRFSKRLFR